MSFTENDRKIQSQSGKIFPAGGTDVVFAQAIASALREEFGGSPAAVKRLARLTQANERTVRNWFEGRNGPNGESLVGLLRESDVVLGMVLKLAGRENMTIVVDLASIRRQLAETIEAIDRLAS
jgi:hypothetical protein